MSPRSSRTLGLAFALASASCSFTSHRAGFVKPEEAAKVDTSAHFLKAHMKDGGVYVLERWNVRLEQAGGGQIEGEGLFFDESRTQSKRGSFVVKLGEVALLETDQPESVSRDTAAIVAVVGVASLTMTTFCIANPKACFGSCPTFFVDDGSGEPKLQAEGFSASIAKDLEATDVDAMTSARSGPEHLDVLMTNDALETHYVRRVRVLAAKRPEGARVYRAGDRYVPVRTAHAASTCSAGGSDCASSFAAPDGREWSSLADEQDLAARETITLTFPRPASGPLGIAVHARNSLLNTYVFYQVLAWAGSRAGAIVAAAETNGAEGWMKLVPLLGDVEVEVRDRHGAFVRIGSFAEVGPIAREVQLVPIPDAVRAMLPEGPIEARLVLGKGSWKIDHVALAEMLPDVKPRVLDVESVHAVEGRGVGAPEAEALARLRAGDRPIVTLPGDAHWLRFPKTEADEELFLESRGWYHEWMRKEWLREEDPVKLAQVLVDPAGVLRRMAPGYKKVEASMESAFWSSRYPVRR